DQAYLINHLDEGVITPVESRLQGISPEDALRAARREIEELRRQLAGQQNVSPDLHKLTGPFTEANAPHWEVIQPMQSDTISIIATGDIVLDRHIYGGERATLGDNSTHGTHLVEETGGAALTYRLIQAVLAAEEAARKDSKKTGDAPPKPDG